MILLTRLTFAFSLALTVSCSFVHSCFARDAIQQLVSETNSLSAGGDYKQALGKLDSAISLASAARRSTQEIDALQMKRIVLLFSNGLFPQAISAVKEALTRTKELTTSINQNPEIGIDADDILDRILEYGASSDSLPMLKLAETWRAAFPQFKSADVAKVAKYQYKWYAKHQQWSQAQLCADRGHKELGMDDTAFLVKARLACLKQHKTKEAERYLDELSKHTPHKPYTNGWYIHLTMWLLNGDDLESAAAFSKKSCDTIPDTRIGPNGNYAVSEAYNQRAALELRQNKLPQAEADARLALKAAIGQAKNEYRANLKLLDQILRLEHKNSEADKLHPKGEVDNPDF